jgi:hypothetical protein
MSPAAMSRPLKAFWASIARFWGAWYRRQDYYSQINQLRGVLGLEPANGLSEAHAVGLYSRVSVFQGAGGQQGLSQVLLTLRTENTRALPAGAFEHFELPTSGHILTPDPGYGAPLIFQNSVLGMGFRFREETSFPALLQRGGRANRGDPDIDGSGRIPHQLMTAFVLMPPPSDPFMLVVMTRISRACEILVLQIMMPSLSALEIIRHTQSVNEGDRYA